MRIAVDGVEIAEAEIDAEMQHHPAPTVAAARRAATEALAVRALLLGEARRRGLIEDGQVGSSPEDAIDRLLAAEVRPPFPDEAACRRYYEANRARLRAPDLFDAEHILLAAAPDDAPARDTALSRARELIEVLAVHPERFAQLAARWSACPSKDKGGHLGPLRRGDTVPAFETFLMSLEPGELCRRPVETRYGVHVVRLRDKIEGRSLDFEEAREPIARFLADSSWQSGVRHYLASLAARARVEGIALPAVA